MRSLLICLALATIVTLSSSSAQAQHWTYPGSIEHHLRVDHGVDTRGMTFSQMLYMHDALHEQAKSTRPTNRAPIQSQPRRLRLFRR